MPYTTTIARFDDLTPQELYDILALRKEVFIVEQTSMYQDPDGLDPQALHIRLTEGETLIGYARIFASGIKFDEASIGRIVIAPNYRGQRLGHQLVETGKHEIKTRFHTTAIRIEAQHHLKKFYESLGFAQDSDIYDWCGIPHIKMCTTIAA